MDTTAGKRISEHRHREVTIMIRGLGLALLAVCLHAASAAAYSPEAYPGWSWGNGTRDFNGFEGYGTQGNVNQGVQWLTLPGGLPFMTYASYNWRMRTQNRTFYDARGPALGAQVSKYFLAFGADYSWTYYPFLDTTPEEFEIYLTGYKRVYYLGGPHPTFFGLPIVGYPTAFWARLSHDFNSLEGSGAQGWVTQSIDWVELPYHTVFRTLASYNWRFRSENQTFYNYQGPGLGVELEHSPLTLGMEYIWRRYPLLHEENKTFELYLTWYFYWDLKKLVP